MLHLLYEKKLLSEKLDVCWKPRNKQMAKPKSTVSKAHVPLLSSLCLSNNHCSIVLQYKYMWYMDGYTKMLSCVNRRTREYNWSD